MHDFTKLIADDMKPALGVTEPGAIAYAVATAKEHTEGEVQKVRVLLNSGMYKNAFTCGIPNSGRFGNLYAAALGAVAARAELKLESLADITEADDDAAAQLVDEGKVEVLLDHMGSEITIDATVITDKTTCTVYIRDSHTNIIKIEKNGSLLPLAESERGEPKGAIEEVPLIHRFRLHDILQYIREVPGEEIAFIKDAFVVNEALLMEGLSSSRTKIGKQLKKENGNAIISKDEKATAQLLCNGAIEARVLGLNSPAMSITGSGAHGIIATMPLYAYYKAKLKEDEEMLLRATALSYLITMYIKEYSGKLSAFCGCGIAAGTGMACGLALLKGASEKQLVMVIQNMASGLTGMICDGGNQGCAMKGIVAVDAAFRAVDMALEDICIESIHGINGRTPEDTMKHMGLIASPGMVETEKTIVEIMEGK